jgi:hypothetical protein
MRVKTGGAWFAGLVQLVGDFLRMRTRGDRVYGCEVTYRH